MHQSITTHTVKDSPCCSQRSAAVHQSITTHTFKLVPYQLQVPQLGCLHFNNCRYVAHEMVSLAYVTAQATASASGGSSAQQPASMGNHPQQTQQFLEVAAELNATGQRYLNQQVCFQTDSFRKKWLFSPNQLCLLACVWST